MKITRFVVVWFILIFFLLVPHIQAQDTTGFIGAIPNAENVTIGWRQSWFSGRWYNFSFTDNFSFTYKYYGYSASPSEDLVYITAFSAAMGLLSTSRSGPTFYLIGYIEATISGVLYLP